VKTKAFGRRAAFHMRRVGRATAGLVLALGACALVASGALSELRLVSPRAVDVAALAGIVAVLAYTIAIRLRFSSPSARAQRASRLARWAGAIVDLQVGLALVVGVYSLVQLSGTGTPLVYLVVAFSATFQARTSAVAVVVLACAVELSAVGRGAATVLIAAEHIAFILLSGVAHALFLRGLVLRQRRAHLDRLETEVRAMREEAREFRLISSSLGAESRPPRSREEEERKLAEGAVETIHQSMYYTLELLKKSLDLHTCVLLWLDDSQAQLRIKELVTDSELVVETPLPADAGAPGAIVRERLLLNLTQPKRGHVPYYAGPEEIGAFLGVPVVEGTHLRGVLCADRRNGVPFGPREEALLQGATLQILRSIQSERLFATVERSKYEHERFYHASAMLGRALTLEQVMDTAFEAAKEICEFDMASIALFDRERKKHRVCRVQVSDEAKELVDVEELDGLEFGESAGLASMVVKNKHYLPAGGELRDNSIPVFTKKIKLRGVESLLVLPLICADEAIGTFTLASRRKASFAKDVREMLGVIANQVAVSLSNAKMYKQMELMATTDGLTGLYNHRTFQERCSEMMGRIQRHGMKLALILTDIDHFKKVNDTYGHPVGDQVLKRVARILERCVRKTDVAARYGGEEFAIVLEGSDVEKAQILAERIRMEVSKEIIQSEKGPFSVTLSLGISCVPDDAVEKHILIERADQALYHAKHNGRNKSVTYPQYISEKSPKIAAVR
jgi:two-component system, cell cycle response regulator